MANRFDKFANNTNEEKEVQEKNNAEVIAEGILNAGKNIDFLEFQMPQKPKSLSKSYYMRADIHQKIKDTAEANNVGTSEFLEYLLKRVFKIQD